MALFTPKQNPAEGSIVTFIMILSKTKVMEKGENYT